MNVVFTNGCFDVIHRGHIELLKYCKSLGYVVVGLNSDSSIKRLKGSSRPIFNVNDRREVLLSCRYVDEVIVFDEDTPYELISQVEPNIIVKGGDYKIEDVVGNDLAEVKIFKYIDGYSTTNTLKEIG
jgi:D-beta-D-heptose 7-phosphate kinase/D-beta-D-heptose 1-phosphate adenosyltransferase